MIKMTRVYGDMYAPREYCTFTNPVTSGGTEERICRRVIRYSGGGC